MKKPDRPVGISQYKWDKFWRSFKDGCKFWTSEDGSFTSLVIARIENPIEKLKEEYPDVFERFPDPELKEGYLVYEWDTEWWDMGGKGKVWRIVDEVTAFPIYYIDIIEEMHGKEE